MQVMWLGHCIHKVRTSGVHYDLMVRIRPETGVFEPIPWTALSTTLVSYAQKKTRGRQSMADWFFTIPMPALNSWWDRFEGLYASGVAGGWPHDEIAKHRMENGSIVKLWRC